MVDFNSLVAEAIDSLPPEFVEKLDNVEVVISDWPTTDELQSVGITPPQTLFGLYQGVPQTKRRGAFQFPDKITIFSGPILTSSTDLPSLRVTIQRVVKHEIAHHFGMDERAIESRGF
jgi:predicted Zn-dependent protease with MMP-like domain